MVTHLAGNALAQQNTAVETAEGADLSKAKGSVLRLQFGPYTRHFTYDSEHKDVLMIGLEREHPDARLDGFTFFTNSFGQPTVYVYPWGGVYPDFVGIRHLSFKWTAGLMYGYKGAYKDKVPLNYNGFSPVVIPALAYEFKRGWSGQLNLLGTAAMMLQLNMTLD